MNSSDDLSELQKFNYYLEKLNAINMFTTLFLIAIGLAGNMSALGVLMLSRKRLPRITGSNYLIALTLTNTLFLAVQFYMGTYNRMIFYFDHNHHTSSLLDSSPAFCKSLPYLRNSARFLNATITVCFSFERLLAVYYPLRARSRNPKYIFLLKIVVVVSFVVPSYSVFLAELTPMSEQADEMYKRYNLSRAFNLNSLSPALGKFSCSASRKHFEKLLVFHGLFWLLMFTAYLMISASLLAIIVKLKNSKRTFLKVSYSSSNSNSSRHVTKTIVRKEQQMIRLSEPSAQQPFCCDNSNENLSTSPNVGSVCPSSFMSSPSRRSFQLANPKIHNTQILTSISLSFVLLNLPFFVAMFVMFYMSMRLGDKRRFAVTDLVDKMKIQIWMLVTDMLQLANFSLTGLLFFCSGQIFRIHAIKFLRGMCF